MMNKLSRREMDIMNILWNAGKPLTASGIAQHEEGLSINTVQVVLKNLLKKSFIRVADIVYSGTVLSRAYEPMMGHADYISDEVLENEGLSQDVVTALLEKETSLEMLDKLEVILQKRRRELQEG